MPRINKFSSNSFVLSNQSGCLLPFLIVFNLLFGWMFLKPATWIIIEAVLFLLFILSSWLFVKKITSAGQHGVKRRGSIDVEAQVLDDKDRTKIKQKKLFN